MLNLGEIPKTSSTMEQEANFSYAEKKREKQLERWARVEVQCL